MHGGRAASPSSSAAPRRMDRWVFADQPVRTKVAANYRNGGRGFAAVAVVATSLKGIPDDTP